MSFNNISKVDTYQKMIDAAFSKATKVNVKRVKGDNLERAKRGEAARLDIMNETIHKSLLRIIREFPGMDNLTEFYSELLKVSVDFDKLKKGLGAVNWADKKARDLVIGHKKRIFDCKSTSMAANIRKAYMGRISSVLKQINENLMYLEECRKIMKSFPIIKQEFTVCIAGFPNVGKSTLLSKITTSKPQIENYAFTTKTLNLGYFKSDDKIIQIIDTPGTLARPEKMNNIEKQAYLAIKYQADLVVFVFDPTDTYPVEEQEQLFDFVKQFRKPFIVFVSKTDIAKKEAINYFLNSHNGFLDKDDLMNEIIKFSKNEIN